MAKTPTPELPYKIETSTVVPPIARSGGAGGQPSPMLTVMKALPAPTKSGVVSFFFVPVGVMPDTIKEPTEQKKWTTGEQRKLANRASSAARRITKDDKTYNIAIRAVTDATKGAGINVYRVAPTTEQAPAAS